VKGSPPPPFAVALNSNNVSVWPDAGVAEAVTWTLEIVTDTEPEAVPPFASVTTTVA